MTTDTPRTDAARTLGGVIVNDSLALLGEPRSFDSINVVPADFARDLERELHDAEIRIQAEVSRTEMLNCELASSNAALDQMTEDAVAIKAEVERVHGLLNRAIELANWFADGYEPLSKEQESRYDGMCANLSALKGDIK